MPRPKRTRQSQPLRNAIDAFITTRLEEKGLNLSPEAGQRALLRRVYFDLIGLPPAPDELRAFLQDHSLDAFEAAVDRLLASPRYGERWARHWMDAAHFAETHGHDQDRIREHAWPYRDYLIASFNDDKPYARFVEEQVAGDVLWPDDPRAVAALGFLAAGPWDESSLRDIQEDTVDRQIGRYLDRDDIVTTVMQTFTSTTVQCARCHDHKFDPISQQDYYSLQAVFAGVDKANRAFDADPAALRRRRELLGLKRRIDQGDRELLLNAETQRQVAEWEQGRVEWKVVAPQTMVSTGGAALSLLPDGSALASGPRPERDTYIFSAPAPLPVITAVRLEALADDSLPQHGPGRQENGNLHLSEFELSVSVPGEPAPHRVALASASADFNQEGWAIDRALDGDEKTAWGIYPQVGRVHQAVFQCREPIAPLSGATLVFAMKQLHGRGHLIGRPRLSVTAAGQPVLAAAPEVERLLAIDSGKRSDDQRAELAAVLLRGQIDRQLSALPKPSLVYAAASDFEPDGGHKPAGAPRPVLVLGRGEITQPLGPASPGALSCVAALAARFDLSDQHGEAPRRAALARWLSHRDNPLTWRSIANRVWHLHFGRGLVDSPNDFGKMGGAPSHPELLDWLAVTLRDDLNGSLKKLHRLLVTSATYRQTAARGIEGSVPGGAGGLPGGAGAVDLDNRFLWRMHRARLDAEQARDAVLMMAGRLDLSMGGPSDRQFDLQPGVHVTPRVDYAKFDVDSEAGRRRSVYRFLFRTLPDPLMDALDCPAGDQLVAARTAGVTVQQALALWNSAFIVRQAEHFAARLESEAGPSLDARIAAACEWVWGRPPRPDEAEELAIYAASHGLANLCRLFFNSNEFLFLN